MPRVLCVWFPKWPIQRLWNERPELRRTELVLFVGQNQRLLVTVCGPGAERRGVRAGQPLAEAKALMRNARFLPADAAADREALRQLALEAHRFSPLAGLEEASFPEALLSDVTGCTHLWGGEERFLKAVREHWTGRGYRTQLALAGSVGAAWALAHTAAATVVPEGKEKETAALSGLSVELLRLPATVLERLHALGLRTIRDLLKLPRETLASRFDVILPQRLDQALGRRPELFVAERLREPLTIVREWDVPLEDRLTLAFLCRQMLQALLSAADHPGAGFQELEGELRTETDAVKLAVRLVRPSRDEAHLAQLVELQLERCTWSGGVIAVRWVVVQLGYLPEIEHNWFAPDAEPDGPREVVALVERLSSRLGEDAVLRVEALPDAQPEHAVQLVPWTKSRPAKVDEYAPPPEEARCRPFRLLGVPQAIAVVSVVPDGPPIRMTWRKEDHRVVRSWGPERIATGWWRAPDVQRDYYRTEWEDGTHAWVFRDLRGGRWFLHGFFE
jgi:protein ImuB